MARTQCISFLQSTAIPKPGPLFVFLSFLLISSNESSSFSISPFGFETPMILDRGSAGLAPT